MGMTSAAEARLDARIRPEITVLRARTPYPKRRPTAPQPSESEPEQRPAATEPARDVTAEAQPVLVRPVLVRPVPVRSVPVRSVPVRSGAARSAPARSGLARSAAQPGPIRLTRRGRIVVGALVVIGAVTAASLLWLAASGQAQASGHAHPGQTASRGMIRVVVKQGQTLWGIALRADPSADPRVIIPQIMDDNALSGTAVQVGEVLWVPRG